MSPTDDVLRDLAVGDLVTALYHHYSQVGIVGTRLGEFQWRVTGQTGERFAVSRADSLYDALITLCAHCGAVNLDHYPPPRAVAVAVDEHRRPLVGHS